MRFAKQNEDGFIQRSYINKIYKIDCTRLTLWEYLLLLEQLDKNQKQNNNG
jgi:hypothetical protein